MIIPTNGFAVFKDKEKCALIRHYAQGKGIIILTDSDSAGFIIRNYLKGIIQKGKITNVYIPDIFGKEKRKLKPSKEGKLGVEGISTELIIEAFKKAGVLFSENNEQKIMITRMDLYDDGFSGGPDSSKKRQHLLKKLGLPELLTTGSMLETINSMLNINDYKKIVAELNQLQQTECD